MVKQKKEENMVVNKLIKSTKKETENKKIQIGLLVL